jgi:predicted phage-related endonuclease
MRDINVIFSELAQYKRLQEETSAIIDTLTDEIKSIMTATNNYKIVGNEHRAAWADVTQSKVDTKQLKEQYPAIAQALTVSSTYKRFTFS